MGIVWGLATSFAIGFADLFARRVVHARGALVAGVSMQAVAIVTSLFAVVVVTSDFRADDLGLGLASGFGMGVGMWGYLGGLQRSSATVVAPIVATMSAVVPYLYAVARGASLSVLGLVGAVVAIAGLVVITGSATSARSRTGIGRLRWAGAGRNARDPSDHGDPHPAGGDDRLDDRRRRRRAGVRWALFSGCGSGFGRSIVIDARSARGSWPAVGQRITAFALILVACRASGADVLPPVGLRLAALVAGILTGLSTVFYLLGVEADPTAAVVTASIFPAISVLVGHVAYDDELDVRQGLGVVIVLVGVIAVALA